MPSFLNIWNPSILAIPTYYLLAVLPHAYAITVATQGQLTRWDNRNPRSSDMKAKLKDRLDAETFAKYKRAESCHINGMENLPLFTAAIILGNMAGLKKEGWGGLTGFAGLWLAVRVAYTVVYLTHTTQGTAATRSALYFSGVCLCFRIIFKAARVLGVKSVGP